MSSTGSLRDLLHVIVDALRGPRVEGAEGTEDTAMMMAMMSIMTGNWQPLERVRVPVKEFLTAQLGSTTRDELAARVVDGAIAPFSEDLATNIFIGENVVDGAEPLCAAREVMIKHIRWVVDGFIDYAGTVELPFSSALKGTCISFAGEWYKTLATMFKTPEMADQLANMFLQFGKQQLQACGTATAGKTEMMRAAIYQMYVTLKTQYLVERGL